ncbi:hypothetical protein P7K49_029467 [Saguinus oedipus]|uniref:DUF3456 domain-containing protein n=1 Tax=Saguinus oedipus TaxID=9490 RepID=A0ABQ9U7A8_SAGOE|nr:hypothetical protein P7K49_029467 [Saguinus oedipus]
MQRLFLEEMRSLGHPVCGKGQSALENPGQPCSAQPGVVSGATEAKVRVQQSSSAWATAVVLGAETERPHYNKDESLGLAGPASGGPAGNCLGSEEPGSPLWSVQGSVDELEWEIAKVDPKKTIQMGPFRINPDGSQLVVEVPYARSVAHLTELLEEM